MLRDSFRHPSHPALGERGSLPVPFMGFSVFLISCFAWFFLDKSSNVAQVFLNALGSNYPSTSASKLAADAWLALSFCPSLTLAFSTEAAAGLPARGA